MKACAIVLLFEIIYLFICFGCVGSSLLHGLFPSCSKGKKGLLSSCSAQASHCSGFSVVEHRLQGTQALVAAADGLQSTGSVVVAQLLRNMWDLPKSWVESVSLTLAGRFFTTEPPGNLIIVLWYMQGIGSMTCHIYQNPQNVQVPSLPLNICDSASTDSTSCGSQYYSIY